MNTLTKNATNKSTELGTLSLEEMLQVMNPVTALAKKKKNEEDDGEPVEKSMSEDEMDEYYTKDYDDEEYVGAAPPLDDSEIEFDIENDQDLFDDLYEEDYEDYDEDDF